MSEKVIPEIAVVGIDIGKTTFHVIGLDRRGAVVLRHCDRCATPGPNFP